MLTTKKYFGRGALGRWNTKIAFGVDMIEGEVSMNGNEGKSRFSKCCW